MKALLKLFCVTAIFILFSSNSFSTPLAGTYTIGSGGNYTTINSAVSDLNTLGVNGAVVFDILTGNYNEQISISSIPGSSIANTVTFKSQTGNPNDVSIGYFPDPFDIVTTMTINGASNLIIRDLSITGISMATNIHFVNQCSNIQIINNRLIGLDSKFVGVHIDEDFSDINTNLTDILIKDNSFEGEFNNVNLGNSSNYSVNVRITGNTFPPSTTFHKGLTLNISNCNSLIVEKNNIYVSDGIAVNLRACKLLQFNKNNIYGYYIGRIGVVLSNCGTSVLQSVISNNFCTVGNLLHNETDFQIENCRNLLFINNTLQCVNNDLGAPVYGISSVDISLINNLLIANSRTIIIDINSSLSVSDYNDFFNGGNPDLINFHGISYNNVTDFYTATALDQYSNSHPVTFQSPTDLHLAGTSIGDNQLAGIPDALVPDDIDGQTRSLFHPYKGADEADFPLPVELSSFTSSVRNNNVMLNWTTASETNNSGFDVERSFVNNEWSKVNFVKGHGNSNTPQNYSYEDRNLNSGKYKYRLKQTDFNGNYEYYNLSNEVVIGMPEKYSLSQNYPNPFNPTTNLEFGIPDLGFVSLKIYDISGKEVATIVNSVLNPGIYKYEFDGSNLASGAYIYKITAGQYSFTKKMLLLK